MGVRVSKGYLWIRIKLATLFHRYFYVICCVIFSLIVANSRWQLFPYFMCLNMQEVGEERTSLVSLQPRKFSEIECSLNIGAYSFIFKVSLGDMVWTIIFGYFASSFWNWQMKQVATLHYEEQPLEFGVSKMNFSLNSYTASGNTNVFEMRTLKECSTREVFPHDSEIEQLLQAAESAEARSAAESAEGRSAEPFLCLDDPSKAKRMVRIAKNKISENFASGHIAADLGIPIRQENYIFAITYETKATDQAERKLRLLLVREGLLEQIANGPVFAPQQLPGHLSDEESKTYYKDRHADIKWLGEFKRDADMAAQGSDLKVKRARMLMGNVVISEMSPVVPGAAGITGAAVVAAGAGAAGVAAVPAGVVGTGGASAAAAAASPGVAKRRAQPSRPAASPGLAKRRAQPSRP